MRTDLDEEFIDFNTSETVFSVYGPFPRLFYKVNDYITLKLIGNETRIFIKGEFFNQCKSLLFEFKQYEDYDSIDDIYDNYTEDIHREIPINVEFWGHCSSLQAWAENNYDTRLIHSNLAFPLLKKLTEVGDIIARRVFKEEIIRRYNSGSKRVRKFLRKEGYLKIFTVEERDLMN